MPDSHPTPTPTSYSPRRTARIEHVSIRDMDYACRVWGTPAADIPVLVLCHGWMDVGASFQFLVDALPDGAGLIVAPDWRGFGASQPAQADHFVHADYLLDLDYLLDHYSPDRPVHLLGHSMGGNVALLYAAVRPARIRRLVTVESFGLPDAPPAEAPQRLVDWMDQVRALREGASLLRSYATLEAVAARLQRTNPRLDAPRAHWLAGQWAAPSADGSWRLRAHQAHRIPNPQLYRAEEAQACLSRVTAPTLCVDAEEDTMAHFWGDRYRRTDYLARMRHISDVVHIQVPNAGHMLHHDQPARLAQLVQQFLHAAA